MKVRDLFLSAENWTKGASARNAYGEVIYDAHSPDAVQWCLSGAINKCYSKPWIPSILFEKIIFSDFFKQYGNQAKSITAWNDLPTTTFEDVMRVVEEFDL